MPVGPLWRLLVSFGVADNVPDVGAAICAQAGSPSQNSPTTPRSVPWTDPVPANPAWLQQRRDPVFKLGSMTTMEDGTALTQARRNDPRVTAIGRTLRSTNIDELPQLLNCAHRGHVHRRTARPSHRAEKDVRAAHFAALAPAQCQAGHHRLGVGQRRSRRDGYARQDAAPLRARSLLHRQLVIHARHEDHPDDAVFQVGVYERVLRVSELAGAFSAGPTFACKSLRLPGRGGNSTRTDA
jgi:hypothetical protein